MPATKTTPVSASAPTVPVPATLPGPGSGGSGGGGGSGPVAEFELRVLELHDLLKTHRTSPFSLAVAPAAHGSKVPNVRLEVGRYRKAGVTEATTIQIDVANEPRVALRLHIRDKSGELGRFFPVGVALTRADETRPVGTPVTTGNKLVGDSPFCLFKLNDPECSFEFTVEKRKVHSKDANNETRTHTTYRFVVFVQDLQTGDIGVIDPEVENPY